MVISSGWSPHQEWTTVLHADGNLLRQHDMPGIGRPHMVVVDLEDGLFFFYWTIAFSHKRPPPVDTD